MKFVKKAVPLLFFVLAAALVLGLAVKEDHRKAKIADTAYVYPVLPETQEWIDMSPAGRRKSCYLSASQVEHMTTRALIETIVTYPFIVDIHAHGSFLDPIHPRWNGIKIVADERFPPLAVLMQRPDAVTALREFEATAVETLGERSHHARYAKELAEVFEAVIAAGDPEGRLAASQTE